MQRYTSNCTMWVIVFVQVFLVVLLNSSEAGIAFLFFDCKMDKFARISCPSSELEMKSKIECLEFEYCCWDATWDGVPKCFVGNPATSTIEPPFTYTSTLQTTDDDVITTSFSTNTTEVTVTSQSTTTAVEAILAEAKLAANLSSNANELLRVLDNGADQEQDIRSQIVGFVLSAAQPVYENEDDTSLSDWVDFFNGVLNYSETKTPDMAQVFLQTSSSILITEAKTVTSSTTAVNNIENYAVAMTTTLLGNDVINNNERHAEVVTKLNDVTITSCYEDSSNSGCDLINDDVTISTTSSNQRRFVSYVTYGSKLGFANDVSFQGATSSLTSNIVSMTSHDGEKSFDDVIVNLTFRKNQSEGANACGFLTTSGNWSDSGCSVTSLNVTHVTCSCDHNTSFALLFLHSDIQFTAEELEYLDIITYIGCGTSITALMLTIFTFVYLKLTRVKRIILHMNLAVTLCLGQIILLIGTKVEVGTPFCKVVAVTLHLLFMTSFSWMLMEGILLYFQSVRAVKGDVNFTLMLGFGWLLPIVIVGVSLGVGFDGYGVDKGCWLSVKNGLTWAFIGPALGFITLNIIMLAMIVRVFLKLKMNAKSGEWQRTRRAVKAIAFLTPLLGLTWVFGVLAVSQSTKWFIYIFSVLNSLQGLTIFVFHCLRNEDVRKAFTKKYKRSFRNTSGVFSTVTPSSGPDSTFVRTTAGFTPRIPHKVKW
uniref:adhesion G protein-coupled receptor L3-like isoform X2 n=1 Tax=Ciona intestinalis TaxID=7719 RepID=UPI000EF48E51|nr:adhesion G protein-coupled receptor L3-like isoform X2 [Ciona intestinalis]|eukprot:XP_026691686.1 adhesion G protein-coupled receptor L3-like isoform X2 [Ciona intestinalis]